MAQKTVLIADDEPHLRLLAGVALGALDLRILEALSGAQALELAASLPRFAGARLVVARGRRSAGGSDHVGRQDLLWSDPDPLLGDLGANARALWVGDQSELSLIGSDPASLGRALGWSPRDFASLQGPRPFVLKSSLGSLVALDRPALGRMAA